MSRGDTSYEAIERRYPKVSAETCLSMKIKDTELWSEVHDSANNVQRNEKLLSLSFFRKNAEPPDDDPSIG